MMKVMILVLMTAVLAATTAFAADGFLYVADQGDSLGVHYYDNDSTGTHLGVYGQTGSQLAFPSGLAFNSDGTLYVTETEFGTVEVFDTAGNYQSSFGNSELDNPVAIIIRDSDGHLFIADDSSSGGKVFEFSDTGMLVQQLPDPEGAIQAISDLAIGPDGKLYIVEYWDADIKFFDTEDSVSPWKTFGATGAGDLALPYSLDFLGTNLFVLDVNNNDVRYFDAQGTFVGIFGETGPQNIDYPWYIRFGPDGKLYVTDEGNSFASVKYFAGAAEIAIRMNTSSEIELELSTAPGIYNIYYSDSIDSPTIWDFADTVTVDALGTGIWTDQIDTRAKRFYSVAIPASGQYLGSYGETGNTGSLSMPLGIAFPNN
jgi:DNA-binding beta-propeller fold protein YncE